jgi:hypothetical protein
VVSSWKDRSTWHRRRRADADARAESVGGLGTASRGRSERRAPPRTAAHAPWTRRTTGELEVVGRALHSLPRGRAWRGRGINDTAMLHALPRVLNLPISISSSRSTFRCLMQS